MSASSRLLFGVQGFAPICHCLWVPSQTCGVGPVFWSLMGVLSCLWWLPPRGITTRSHTGRRGLKCKRQRPEGSASFGEYNQYTGKRGVLGISPTAEQQSTLDKRGESTTACLELR